MSRVNPPRSDFYELAAADFDRLKGARPDLAELLAYFAAVLELQRDARSAFRPALKTVDLQAGSERLAEEQPFLQPGAVQVDAGTFDALLNRIIAVSRERTGAGEDAWPPVAVPDDSWRQAVVAGALGDEASLQAAAERVDMDPSRLAFLACQVVSPFLETYADSLRDAVAEAQWQGGRCPVCGGEPVMGELTEDTGQRRLHCHLCRTAWTFQRVECPFCGTKDQEKLRYFFDEEAPAYRVDVCDACGTYLKTVDFRRPNGIQSVWLHSIVTLHLDVVASREGFHRETNKMFGL